MVARPEGVVKMVMWVGGGGRVWEIGKGGGDGDGG